MNLITGFLSKAKYILLALIAGLVIGGFVGWYEKSLRVEAAQVEAVTKARTTDANEVAKALANDVQLEEVKVEIREKTKYITKEIVKYVPTTPARDYQENASVSSQSGGSDCAPVHLSYGAVSLLNESRGHEAFHPDEWSNAEIEAPTEIGMRELSQADAELAGLYQELAANHDQLVEDVNAYMEYQRNYLKDSE
jgi:hypothetical protein